jgi:hypothetical protein
VFITGSVIVTPVLRLKLAATSIMHRCIKYAIADNNRKGKGDRLLYFFKK